MLPLFGNIAFAQMRVKAIRDDYRHADHAEGFADRASLQRCPGFAEQPLAFCLDKRLSRCNPATSGPNPNLRIISRRAGVHTRLIAD